MTSSSPRIAVILFNLGGPDRPDAVRPFLFNLFNDPSILRLPNPMRFFLASLISRRRAKEATKIYEHIGGGSPLLPNTQAQADALQTALTAREMNADVHIAMRYWHPMAMETAVAVQETKPDLILLVPLYPQFSTTTTASSARVWHQAARQIGLNVPTRLLCCYPWQPGFIAAMADLIRTKFDRAAEHGRPRVLLSAHGLPERIVRTGDPYQWQCEQTALALVEAMGIEDLDWVSCYQSRVGPMKWIGPSTDDEIARAGKEGRPLVVVPVAFVSEHSETLVELDIEYRELAEESGVPAYERVPTVDAHPAYIDGLADEIVTLANEQKAVCPADPMRTCPQEHSGCPLKAA
ncbi:MAG: ferrochelatase [Pseudomonadota bacterium]